MPKPNLDTVPIHLHEEIELVPEDDLRAAFAAYRKTMKFFRNIPDDK